MLHKNIQRYPTLYEGVFERANSLNFLRLILASCVIFSHTPYLVMGAKVDEHPLVHNFYVFGDYAVNAFFCISGFLIAHSAYRSGAGSYCDGQQTQGIIPTTHAQYIRYARITDG